MKAKKGKFRVDFLEGGYEGYYFDSPSDTWNGHYCPFLTFPARTKFMEDIGCFSAELIDTEDGELYLFPIGSQQLKWEKIG